MFRRKFPHLERNLSVPLPVEGVERGFSLVEVMAAMVILLIALLAVVSVFSYVVNFNQANSTRSQALSVLKQETELLRSAKFTPFGTDAMLIGGIKAAKTVVAADQNSFNVAVTVDDDPFAAGVQTNAAPTLKEITITVSPSGATFGAQAAAPVTTILRRVRTN